MPDLRDVPAAELRARRDRAQARYDALRAGGLKLDLTRGKPSPEQLDLANALLTLPGADDYLAADGTDCRNYGALEGLPEARALFAPMLGAPPEQVLVADNSSLALMHDAIVFALLSGVPGGRGPWSAEGPVTFLCPSPGYDRHFAICQTYGIRMITVALTGRGPDLAEVERLVADPSVKGIWCVPKYSNPTGESYSAEAVERLAGLAAAAPDFRIFWDNAYAVHRLTDRSTELANMLEACARHGQPNRALVFGSTSKITYGGGGLALFAASPENVRWFAGHMGKRTIGPDKLNQLRHVRLLRDMSGVEALMEGHRRILAPKFRAVLDTFAAELEGVATWTEPEGGYFVSLDVLDGCARRVVDLARAAGVALTPAGSTFPCGRDPRDRNIRIAPTFPRLAEVRQAAEAVAICVQLATSEALLERQAATV
ncbi:MAG TPA: aminotransferase class I/II-fold pyridoxal phosphate-dependent enzyme [Chloroflexota bacterium]